jgi:hypothetical protein
MRKPESEVVKQSALDEIDAGIQPIGPQPGLRAEVDRLVELEDVRALVSLYDAYMASAEAFQSIENQPRSGRANEILGEECAHACSKAYYVADRLKALRPDDGLEPFVETLFNCTLAMGNNLSDAIAVVNEINAWPKIKRAA